jgi:hypothetical protein
VRRKRLGFFQDSSGDRSSSRLISFGLGVMTVVIAAIACIVALRDSPNSGAILQALAMLLTPLGGGVVGVMWKRNDNPSSTEGA